jgi:hypothetical protein
MDILNVIERFNVINNERKLLNKQIKDYYTPLLIEAATNNDETKFNDLISEIPDCPFLMTAYRIGMSNFNK